MKHPFWPLRAAQYYGMGYSRMVANWPVRARVLRVVDWFAGRNDYWRSRR